MEEAYTFTVQINGKTIQLTDKIFESGKKLSEIWKILNATIQFTEFQENLKKGQYKEVYTSPVFDAIMKFCEDDNCITIPAGTKVFRARIIKNPEEIYSLKNGIHREEDALRGYDRYNSKEPAVGISSEGRANNRYSSYFYCANDASTAASEVKANIGEYISLASFTIQRDLQLIRFVEKDLFESKSDIEHYHSSIAKHFSSPVSDSSEYKLTQFISDEIRKCGIDGICYKSHFTDKNNYVIFNCSINTISFCNSKVIKLHSKQLNFIDFSGEKMLPTKAIADLDQDQIHNEKHHIFDMMEAYEQEKILNDQNPQ